MREKLVTIPVIGYTLRILSNIVRLPRTYNSIKQSQDKFTTLVAEVNHIQNNSLIELQSQLDELKSVFSTTQLAQDKLSYQISFLKPGLKDDSKKTEEKVSTSELFADDHLLDKFYLDFEDRFRGSELVIQERQEEYLPLFTNSKVNFQKTPVLDIGSGRGEFTQLLKNKKIRAIGLDINMDMVKRSRDKGLEAVQGDAGEHLQSVKPQTYGAITGFHIVEHIPFNVLLRIFDNALKALAENGFIIFETPNPENIIVASSGFYTDPSHLNPLPPDLLAFALETCGFRKVEIMRLHPVEVGEKETKGLPKEIAERFYGPRDYAVIGYK